MIAPAFRGYEIRPVFENENGTCEPQDSFATAEQRALAEGGRAFWSLYGRLQGGGVECIADRDSYPRIAELYCQLTGNAVPDEAGSAYQLRATEGRDLELEGGAQQLLSDWIGPPSRAAQLLARLLLRRQNGDYPCAP